MLRIGFGKPKMEKISAAHAMEWSIDLEKGLRSKNPCYRIEAIKQIGYKLQQWSTEPSITMEILDMYGMVPGEDRLFANTILLRLADAFCNGDGEIRKCILKVFLVELQHIAKKGKLYNGILAMKRVPNHLELLKRLKSVYETGDLEAKSMTLRLFGCWADLAKDNVNIRSLILSSMQSNHNLEVKASLFAAGCFSILSEDFACIVLKILIGIISSISRSRDVRLAAVQALANLRCSLVIRNNAYKAGRRLLVDLAMDDVKAELLSSLSKLASETSLLFPEQVDLLQVFLSREYPTLLKERALRCLYVLLGGVSCHFLVSKSIITALFSIFDDIEFLPELQCLALQILRRKLLSFPILDMPELLKLIEVVKNVDAPKRKKGLAVTFLVDILCSMKEALLVSNVSLLIMDSVNFLVKEIICSFHKELKYIENQKFGSDEPFVLKKELKFLLDLILRLAKDHPSSALVALSRLSYIIYSMVSILNNFDLCIVSEAVSQRETSGEKDDHIIRPVNSNAERNTIASALILYLCRFATVCMNIFLETSSITSEVLHILKDVVNCIKQCGYSCYNSCEVFSLIIHSFDMCYCFKDGEENKAKGGDELFCHYSICWLPQEYLALDFTKKMLKKGSFWEVYRAGKYFCLKGLWFSATFSFRKLMDAANSGYYSYWIKALMLFTGGESEIKLLLFPKVSSELIKNFHSTSDSDQSFRHNRETDACFRDKFDGNAFRGNLSRVCSRIWSSEKILEASANVSGNFFFQKWFLTLRGKFLELVVETFGLLNFNTLDEDKFKEGSISYPGNATKLIQDMHALLCAFSKVSFKFNNLAKCYDILATSFMDIDAVSFRSILRLSCTCSALAFCTSFATNALSSPSLRNIVSSSINKVDLLSNLKVAHGLAERLWDIDYTTARKLVQFILVKDEIRNGLYSRTNMHNPGLFDNAFVSLIQSAVDAIVSVQTDLEVAEDVEVLFAISQLGSQHLCHFIRKFMEIPLVTPKYFFKVGPCVGSELFIFHAKSEKRDELFVRPGFQLPLNLCIQLKNASSVAKVYCVLAVRASDRLSNVAGRSFAPAQCTNPAPMADETLWLSEILLLHLKTNGEATDGENRHIVDDASVSTTCVCFALNKMGLGFSSCLLNVSQLSEGSYPIKWHSCCVDDNGFYWNLIPFNEGSVFTVKD
ncbi:hypothetical protein KSP40_PGU004767 [Platanthera guangdongensis]|uniref:Integrator complex subunit 7 n=1 Tax=Platanthera guangdongensis TaxID=2320717 RepID=A0ABR2LPL5_9ASPA